MRKDVHPNFLAHFIIMWSFSTAMPRSMTWAFLRWSNEHLNLLISSARLLLSRYPLHIPFACTNLSWIVVIGCSDFSFFHILLPRDSPLLGMQSGTPRHTRIFDKMDIINGITNTYSRSIKTVDTRYRNTIYSTGFHCARFQQEHTRIPTTK